MIKEKYVEEFNDIFEELDKEQSFLSGVITIAIGGFIAFWWNQISNIVYPYNAIYSAILYLTPCMVVVLEMKYNGWLIKKLMITSMKFAKVWHNGDEE